MTSTIFEPHAISNKRLFPAPANTIWRMLPHGLVIVGCVLGVFFAHEIGHALVAHVFGARIVMFNVLGMQWYPKLEWVPELGLGGYVYWFAPVNGDDFYRTNHRLIMMAGSNFTLLLAVGAVTTLYVTRLRGVWRTALAAIALYFLDSLLHALPATGLLPFGWSVRFTRSFSEAYFAAVGLGIPAQVYLGALVVVSILIPLLLWRALRK